MTRMLTQYIVSHSPNEDTRTLRSKTLHDATLDNKEIFFGELVLIEVATTSEKRLYHMENATEKTFLLIASFKESLTKSTLLGS